MGYSKEVKAAAIKKLENRRLAAQYEAENRKIKIFQELPEAEKYERQIASCGVTAAKAVLKGGNVKEELESLKAKSLKLQEEYKAVLDSMGYTVEDTEPQYTCKKCNDTGYVEVENRTVMCECLKKAMIESACAELNRYSPLSLCTFEDFSLNYYSHDIESGYPRSSYEQMNKNLNVCKDYARNFTKNSPSLFMRGETGLGKTHLSLAIANEVIKKGYGVIYVSAPALVSKLEKEHFSYGREESTTESAVLDCDLLIIDDLGTEFITQFSSSAIYNIFNSRLLAGKPIIINTNLSMSELDKRYTDRFVSRIVGQAVRLDFFGNDVRISKN